MTKARPLFRQIFLPFFSLVFALILITTWITLATIKSVYRASRITHIKNQALLFGRLVSTPIKSEAWDQVDALCKEWGRKSGTRFTVVLPSGRVIGDTQENPWQMENHRDRPEIRGALEGRIMVYSRYSFTRNQEMVYVAMPLEGDASPKAVIRAAFHKSHFYQPLSSPFRRLLYGMGCLLLFSSVIIFFITRRIQEPVSILVRTAEEVSKGSYASPFYGEKTAEWRVLSESMHTIAKTLSSQTQMLKKQKEGIDAILSAMTEAVLVINLEDEVTQANRTAAEWFGMDSQKIQGRSLCEVLRHPAILAFLRRIQETGSPERAEFSFDPDRWFEAYCTTLLDEEGNQWGTLLILRDISHIKKLETTRRDFVANVSHELKTPITAIQGFVETLQEGAIDHPDEARRFLEIISRHTERLTTLVDDLLKLSRLEKEELSAPDLIQGKLVEPIEEAIAVCREAAEKKNILIEVWCPPELTGTFAPDLLAEALINLIGNAIKYSPEGGRVLVSAEDQGDRVVLHVRDWGCGIPKAHLDRIFERFYRVDKARSRRLGGTGLGLSIVKHIMQIHGGSVSVQSTVGEGSTFTLELPKKEGGSHA